MITLFVSNLTKSKVNEKFLRLTAEKTLRNLPKLAKKNKKFEIDLAIIGEKRMKKINRTWRKKNKATDVLSFENQKPKIRNKKKEFKFITPLDDIVNLGQIFICFPVAERQAKEYGFTAKEELARLLVHGILHLAGYDHERSAREEKKMFYLQEKILRKT